MRLVRAYLKANGHTGEHNAVKQSVIQKDLGLTRREIRKQIESINNSIEIKDMISFSNNGVYIVNSQQELQQIRARALRAVQRNQARINKANILLKEEEQLTFGFEWDNDTITK